MEIMNMRYRAIIKGAPADAYKAAGIHGVRFLEKEYLSHVEWTVCTLFPDYFRQVYDWLAETQARGPFPSGSLLWFQEDPDNAES
jgi:hypothetical protein